MPRKPQRDDAGYGVAVCIDCRRRSARRLPERFPHICADCLFGTIGDALAAGIIVERRTRHSREHSRASSPASQ